jgi:hypothetical protein
MHLHLPVKCPSFFPILTKSDLLSEDLIRVLNMKCHENPYFGGRVVSFGETDEWTDRKWKRYNLHFLQTRLTNNKIYFEFSTDIAKVNDK